MKKFLIALLNEFIVIYVASLILFFVWNDMAANYFHWKDIDPKQAVMITALFRVLTIKLD